ncbi:MAG TPA: PepSY domain-containing protein [Actinoplanes sp.]|nr:PepSY domain-containing protein [Actinoplanes sp.]
MEDLMRRSLLIAVTVAGVVVPLSAGTALAMADDSADRRNTSAGFEIEIDPELDAKFGPRPVNAVQAADIVTRRFPGARVLKGELDERAGGPIWEMEFRLRGNDNEVDVDAVTGAILSGGDDRADDDERDDD